MTAGDHGHLVRRSVDDGDRRSARSSICGIATQIRKHHCQSIPDEALRIKRERWRIRLLAHRRRSRFGANGLHRHAGSTIEGVSGALVARLTQAQLIPRSTTSVVMTAWHGGALGGFATP